MHKYAGKFLHILCKLSTQFALFSDKFTRLTRILHDRWSHRSRQISTLFYDWFSLGISASRSIWGSRLNNIDIIEKYTRILRHTLKRSDKHILWVVNRVNDYFILSRHFPFQRHDLNILERPLEPLLQKLVLWPGSLSLEVLERINCKSLNTTSTIFITKVNSGSNGQLAAAMQVYANN